MKGSEVADVKGFEFAGSGDEFFSESIAKGFFRGDGLDVM